MIISEPVDFGPLEATFEADLARIRRGQIAIILLASLVAAFSAVVVVFGLLDSVAKNPQDAVFARFAYGMIGVAALALGVHLFRKTSRESTSRVAVHEQGLVVDWQGERFSLRWSDIQSIKIEDALPFPWFLGGLVFLLLFAMLGGGKRSTLLLTFADRSCTLLPPYLSRMPELSEIVSARTNIPIPKLRK